MNGLYELFTNRTMHTYNMAIKIKSITINPYFFESNLTKIYFNSGVDEITPSNT